MTVHQDAEPLVPAPDALTKPFWDGAREHRLVIQRCAACGHRQHPPEPVCAACLSFDLDFDPVSGRGTVYTHSVAMQVFHPWFADKLPYVVAVVQLDEQPGLRLVSNVVDCDPLSVDVGDRVEVAFRPHGSFVLPVFRPAAAG